MLQDSFVNQVPTQAEAKASEKEALAFGKWKSFLVTYCIIFTLGKCKRLFAAIVLCLPWCGITAHKKTAVLVP